VAVGRTGHRSAGLGWIGLGVGGPGGGPQFPDRRAAALDGFLGWLQRWTKNYDRAFSRCFAGEVRAPGGPKAERAASEARPADHAGASSTRTTRVGIGLPGVKVEPGIGSRGAARPPRNRPGGRRTWPSPYRAARDAEARETRRKSCALSPAPSHPTRESRAIRGSDAQHADRRGMAHGLRSYGGEGELGRVQPPSLPPSRDPPPPNQPGAPRVPRGSGAFGFERALGPAWATARGAPTGRSPSRMRAPSRTSRAATGPRPVRAACRADRRAARAGAPRCPGAPRPSADR
jgi:hypothetical protein